MRSKAMKTFILACVGVGLFGSCSAAPVDPAGHTMWVPARLVYTGQTRGPLDFIGNWIQSSDWFPIEINVPDTLNSIGNNVGSFTSTVGNNINNFAQNVGAGFQTFTQNIGNGFQNIVQRVPILAAVVRPTKNASGTTGQRVYLLMAGPQNAQPIDVALDAVMPVSEIEHEILQKFP